MALDIAELQRYADADHERQPVCSWCHHPGIPYEYNGVRFDGLTGCQGDRLCPKCTTSYLENTPLLVAEVVVTSSVESTRIYDLNPNTRDWSEKNIPGCYGEPPVQAIAAEYRYADYRPPRRRGQ